MLKAWTNKKKAEDGEAEAIKPAVWIPIWNWKYFNIRSDRQSKRFLLTWIAVRPKRALEVLQKHLHEDLLARNYTEKRLL